jgi:hypothetical protein
MYAHAMIGKDSAYPAAMYVVRSMIGFVICEWSQINQMEDFDKHDEIITRIIRVRPRGSTDPWLWGIELRTAYADLGSLEGNTVRIIDNDQREHVFMITTYGIMDNKFTVMDLRWDEYFGTAGTTVEDGVIVPFMKQRVIDNVAMQHGLQVLAKMEKDIQCEHEALCKKTDQLNKDRVRAAALQDWVLMKKTSLM